MSTCLPGPQDSLNLRERWPFFRYPNWASKEANSLLDFTACRRSLAWSQILPTPLSPPYSTWTLNTSPPPAAASVVATAMGLMHSVCPPGKSQQVSSGVTRPVSKSRPMRTVSLSSPTYESGENLMYDTKVIRKSQLAPHLRLGHSPTHCKDAVASDHSLGCCGPIIPCFFILLHWRPPLQGKGCKIGTHDPFPPCSFRQDCSY